MKTGNLTSPVLAMVCFFCFVTANAEPYTYEAPSNLLSNGSFEEGDYSPTGSPTDWARDAFNPSAILTWDDTQARTSDKSVKIYAPTANDVGWIQTVDVEPSTVYFLSGWIKTDNVGHTSQSVDAGANLSRYYTWDHSAGVFGTQDWTRDSLLFNSEDDTEVTVGARLGYWSGTTTGTAWFDDLKLEPIVPMDPHPSWKILVLIYQETDFEVTDDVGIYHHYVASMTQDEMDRAALAAKQFVEIDIPALTSGNMVPEVTVRFPDHALTQLSPLGGGWWPSPEDTASQRDPEFDSVFVIWDTRAIDLTTGGYEWIGAADGLTAFRGTHQTYVTMQIDAAISRGHRNVFKHEWGHSILHYFDAIGTSPKPAVNNHTDALQYVNCHTSQLYVWEDETLANPIPNSIYNNESGFTHDYYSGTTATADQPSRCLGIPPEAWALGGPVSHSGNIGVSEVNLLATDNQANELGLDPGEFTFTRSTDGNLGASLSVSFSGAGSTASNGIDHVAYGGSIIIPANELSVTLAVVPLADNLIEDTEVVVLTISANGSYTIGTNNTAQVSILDDGDADKDGLSDVDELANNLDPLDPDTDDDGIGDALEVELLNPTNFCIGADAYIFSEMVVGSMTCAARISITVVSLAEVQAMGNLHLIAPFVSFENGFSVLGSESLGYGSLKVTSENPCPGCP